MAKHHEVFCYVISGAKHRAPAAAMALIARGLSRGGRDPRAAGRQCPVAMVFSAEIDGVKK